MELARQLTVRVLVERLQVPRDRRITFFAVVDQLESPCILQTKDS